MKALLFIVLTFLNLNLYASEFIERVDVSFTLPALDALKLENSTYIDSLIKTKARSVISPLVFEESQYITKENDSGEVDSQLLQVRRVVNGFSMKILSKKLKYSNKGGSKVIKVNAKVEVNKKLALERYKAVIQDVRLRQDYAQMERKLAALEQLVAKHKISSIKRPDLYSETLLASVSEVDNIFSDGVKKINAVPIIKNAIHLKKAQDQAQIMWEIHSRVKVYDQVYNPIKQNLRDTIHIESDVDISSNIDVIISYKWDIKTAKSLVEQLGLKFEKYHGCYRTLVPSGLMAKQDRLWELGEQEQLQIAFFKYLQEAMTLGIEVSYGEIYGVAYIGGNARFKDNQKPRNGTHGFVLCEQFTKAPFFEDDETAYEFKISEWGNSDIKDFKPITGNAYTVKGVRFVEQEAIKWEEMNIRITPPMIITVTKSLNSPPGDEYKVNEQ